MNPFRVIVLGVFTFFIIFGVLVFSGFIPIGQGGAGTSSIGGTVTIWGTVPRDALGTPFDDFKRTHDPDFVVEYVERRTETFDRDLVEALASGVGPDMILLSQDLIMRHADKILPLPYESMTARQFTDAYIEEGEVYLTPEGILALPFTIDPLVMYWNRDLFSSAGIAAPPQYWDEFFTVAPQLTKTDAAANIAVSAVGLGEYRNIDHAKDILALITIQAGNPIVEISPDGAVAVLASDRGLAVPPAESAARFYTEFSNSAKPFYSWNRSLRGSKDLFIAGDLAVYFGYAGERGEIADRSPHLNFDVALMPQIRDAAKKSTFGALNGIAVLRVSRNPQTAFYAAFLLTGTDFIAQLAAANGMPAVRRDVLAARPAEPYAQTFRDSALVSTAWLDPDPSATEGIFQELIESIVSGRRRISEAVDRADREISALLAR